ncbi:MAG: hypothetical protein ACI4FX_05995 [Agathobacter sp.]
MRSKTSFFNKAIYKKNMTLYWPIPVCYLLYGLIKIPGSLWSGLRKNVSAGNDVLVTLFSSLSVEQDLYVLAAVAVITGMAMFGYLFSSKSANMIHALPVTRTELYVTNVISGLTCILLPQLLVFLVSVVFCLLRGITCVQYLALWLFCVAASGIFFYSLVSFCVMITGLLAALPFCFLLLNYLSVGVVLGIQYVLSSLGYGLSYSGMDPRSVGYILSPLAYLTDIVGFRVDISIGSSGQMKVTSVSFDGTAMLLIYAAAALVFFGLAWYGYQKRRLERTGDLLTFGWGRPLFRWGLGGAIGFLGGIFLSNFLGSVAVWMPKAIVLLFILVFGMIGFFIADMLIQKSFRVLCFRRLKECGCYVLAVCGCFAVLYGVGYYQEQYIPDESEVASAYIYMNYPVESKGADVKRVTDIQREILANREEFQSVCREEKNYTNLTLAYCMKDGSVLTRTYQIPSETEVSGQLAEEVFACEAAPDSFMKYVVGYDYDRITQIEEAQVECQNANQNYVTFSMDEDTARKINEAVYKDVEEGTIQKYNLENYILNEAGTTKEYRYAYLTIFFKHTSSSWGDVYSIYQDHTQSDKNLAKENYESVPDASGSIYLKFGADCKNIMKTLVETGVISSEDEIIFSSDGETTMG